MSETLARATVRPAKLYTPELLALAVGLSEFALNDTLDERGSARSRTCGSVIEIGCTLGSDGQIATIGASVTACAVGQASAAIFLQNAGGQTHRSVQHALDQIEVWLSGDGPLPDWPGIEALTPARAHPARHGAIALPWRAALAALCKDASPR